MDGEFLLGAKTTCWFSGSNLIESHVLTNPAAGKPLNWNDESAGESFVQVATPFGQRWAWRLETVDGNPCRPVRKTDRLIRSGRIAWLAFCSGACLKREGRRFFPPSDLWKELIAAPDGFSDRTVVFEDALGLPKSVNLYWTNNLPILQYRVLSSTNVLGWEFPLEFYLAQYRPATAPESQQIGNNGWELQLTAKGAVTSIKEGSKPEIPAEVWKAVEK